MVLELKSIFQREHTLQRKTFTEISILFNQENNTNKNLKKLSFF